jgi:hypothetical protein
MSVRPTLTKDIRKTAIQQHQANKGKGNYNSFQPLTPKGRTFSFGKRQLDSTDNDHAQSAKTPKLDSSTIFSQLKDQDSILSDLDSELAKLAAIDSDQPKDPRLDGLCRIVSLMAKSQKNLTSAILDAAKISEGSSGAAPALAPGGEKSLPIGSQGSAPAPGRKKPAEPISESEAASKKVKQVLRDAEKKTVLFNLNLGKNPIMNKESLSCKVTESLVSSVRTGLHDYHIGDAEVVLDDILSCTKLEFLGNSTKLFYNHRNPNDSRNNSMYTVPVRMDFKDKESRFEAEIMLRKVCKVNCSVPYLKKLRSMLGDLVKQGKQLQPDCFIRTKVNVDKLFVEVHAKTASGWLDLGIKKDIPLNILDMSTAPALEEMQVQSIELPQIS